MPLVDVRRNFITYSGRYDLIVNRTTYADNGADFYIHAGQQYLDTLATMFKSESKYYYPLVPSSWYILVPDARVVEEVYVSTSTGAKHELRKLSLEEFRSKHTAPITNSNSQCSEYFAVANLRTTPQVPGQITIGDFTPAVLGNEHTNLGVLLSPPVGAETSAEVVGKFYQPKLAVDSDVNFWSEMYPQILVMSACRQLEISYRNTVGVKDWETSIKSELLGLELDYADQESTGIRKFAG